MSLSILPPEVLLSIVEEIEHTSDLCSFTLVSKVFRAVSKSDIWSSISLDIDREQLDKLSELIGNNRMLGEFVNSLRINSHYQEDPWRFDQGTPTMNERVTTLATGNSKLFQFAKLFPNMSSLNLGCNASREMFDISTTHLDFTFYSLTYLSFDANKDRELHLLRDILAMSPNLTSLHLSQLFDPADSARFPTIANCPILKNLSITSYSRFSLFDSSQPLFQPVILSSLESFSWSSTRFEDLNVILSCNCSTLQIFKYNSQFPFDGVSRALPNLVALQSLEIFNVRRTPENLLQLLPTQMQKLSVPLTRAQLEHLRNNPRPRLQLKVIHLQQWEGWKDRNRSEEKSPYNFIPMSVETLIIDYAIRCDELLEIYSGLKENQHNSSIKTILVVLKANYRSKAEKMMMSNPIISIFENIGIKLKTSPCDRTYDGSCLYSSEI